MARHEQYERDGFIPCIDVLTAEETAQLRVDFDALEADLGKVHNNDASGGGTPGQVDHRRIEYLLSWVWHKICC